ncbi:MAG: response regulator [Bacteroidetes bacterium]|nr:response regulator [Bacteroidota bacterium]
MGGEYSDKSDFRVLLVEDNQGDVVLFNEALDHLNKSVLLTIVKDSLTAIEFLNQSQKRNHLPDLILTDINMPGMSGKDLLIVLKRI